MRLLTKTAAAAVMMAGLGMLAAPAAEAIPQVIQYNLAFSTGQAPGLTPTDFVFTTDFQQWDPAAFVGSTLTGVFISVTGNSGGTVDFYDSTTPGCLPTCTGGGTLVGLPSGNPTKAGVEIRVKTPDAPGLIVAIPTTILGANQTIAAGSTLGAPAFTLALGGTDTQTHNVAAGDIAMYIGAGILQTATGSCFLVTPNSACSFSITNATGNVGTAPHITAEQSGFIKYTYDDGVTLSPEPASMALLGAGLLGLAAFRRRFAR